MDRASDIRRNLTSLLGELFPGGELRSIEPLSADVAAQARGTGGATEKLRGYGQPLRVVFGVPGEKVRSAVFHLATANDYGHDRRADRAAELLLAFDRFGTLPRHVRPLDIGAIGHNGALKSLRECGEFYLLTEWAEGRPYSEDLRRIAATGELESLDLDRCDALCSYLVRLHRREADGRTHYRRSVRDLLGHGEGIFGIIDGYPPTTEAAPPERLERIEQACLSWRWRLRATEHRASRIHGDFHPFNLVFSEGTEFSALDAARGGLGDPADDVTALAVNFLFFALEAKSSWRHGLGVLWHRFWNAYLAQSGDRELLGVVAPYFAWRSLVVCNPQFYPSLLGRSRDALFGLVEHSLCAHRFDPEWADGLFP